MTSLLARLQALKPQSLSTAQLAALPHEKRGSISTRVKPKQDSPSEPTQAYWRPNAVILWHPTWQCTCGASGPCTPQLFVREQHGSSTRLRSIESPNQYALLPRFVEHAAPSHVHFCPECFAGTVEFAELQMSFDWPEPPTPYTRAIAEIESTQEKIEHLEALIAELTPQAPTLTPSYRETTWHDYEFTPGEDEWRTSRGTSSRLSVYIHSVASDDGPEQPYCYHEYRD